MKNPKNLKIFLTLTFIEGLLGTVYLFSIPSMGKNAALLGFSASRLVVGGISISLLICLAILLFKSFTNQSWVERQTKKIYSILIEKSLLLPVSVSLLLIIAIGSGILYLNYSPVSVHLNNLKFVIDRILGLYIWGLAILFQLLILLSISFNSYYREKDFYNSRQIYKTALLIIITISSILHWFILYFKIQLFASIPYWTWFFHEKEHTKDLLFVPILILAIVVVWFVLKHPGRIVQNLILLFALGYALQVGFGYIEGEGFESIRTKAAEAGHVVYFEYAVDNPVLSHVMTNYEDAYGWETWLGTKPPGVIFFYIISQKISNMINPTMDYAGRFMRLTNFAAYVYPLLTFLAIFPLFHLARRISESDERAYLACIFYVFFPNIILMPLELDQVLFPLLSILCLLSTWQIIKNRSMAWAILTGALFYICLFFTFSILPLIALILLWIFLDHIKNVGLRAFNDLFFQGLGILIGISIVYLLQKFTINYDFYIRFSNSMAHHTSLKEYESGLPQVLAALKLNNLELAAWVGFPAAFLLISRFIRTIGSYIMKRITKADVFSAALLLMFILLNFLGRTRGEVGRLWIFLLPMFSVLLAIEVVDLYKRKKLMVTLIIALQMVTTMMTFKFQDYF